MEMTQEDSKRFFFVEDMPLSFQSLSNFGNCNSNKCLSEHGSQICKLLHILNFSAFIQICWSSAFSAACLRTFMTFVFFALRNRPAFLLSVLILSTNSRNFCRVLAISTTSSAYLRLVTVLWLGKLALQIPALELG